ncbi:hypothetical protein D3C71_1402370 [compost metagenome]
MAFVRGDTQQAEVAGLRELDDVGHGGADEVDLIAQQGLHRRTESPEGHVCAADLELPHQAGGCQMADRAGAARSVVQSSGRRIRRGHQVGDGSDVRFGMNGKDQRRGRDAEYRGEVPGPVVRHLLQAGQDHVPGRHEEQGVAVRLRLGRGLGSDDPVAARAVVDDDGLAEFGARLLADDARHDVADAARPVGHDDFHRCGGERVGCHGAAGQRERHGSAR